MAIITTLLLIIIVWVVLLRLQDRQTPVVLQQLAKQLAGSHAVDCGTSTDAGTAVESETQFFKVNACAVKAFQNHQNFYAYFEHDELGFFKMGTGIVDCDYVIRTPQGKFKMIRWKRHANKNSQQPVTWTQKDLSNVHVTTWGYPGYQPILKYSDDQF